MRPLKWLAAGTAGGLLLAGCGGGAETTAEPVTVFAAASLREVFPAVAALDPGLGVTFTFDGSAALLDQLTAGATADVFATADVRTMDKAIEAGVVADAATEFTTNVLTLVVPAGNPGDVTGMDESLDGVKLVICAPEVPCGGATATLAETVGITLAPVSEETSVTNVLGRVTSGEADAGIVYVTDATAAGDQVEAFPIPQAESAATHYMIATVAEAPAPDAAQRFIDLVLSDDGQALLAEYGFGSS